MPAPYFYSKDFPETNLLSEDTSKHIIQVLRMKVGDQVNITNGKGYLFITKITVADKRKTEVQVIQEMQQPPHDRKICIALSPLKNTGRYEWFLEKATELGVSHIIPLMCARTEKQNLRQDRIMNIIVSAMLQSQQVWLPVLSEPLPFSHFIKEDISTQKFIAHCENDELKDRLLSFLPFSDASILIGPEGDFTSDEIQIAIDAGYKPVSLGDKRLRTETAGIVAATILNL